MEKLHKLLKNKLFISSAAVVVVIVIGITAVILGIPKPILLVYNSNKTSSSNLHIETESDASVSIQSDITENFPSEFELSIDLNKKILSEQSGSKPLKIDGDVSIGTKNPPTTDEPKASDQPSNSTPEKGGVVSVTPVPRPDAPPPASGNTPQDSEWISVNPNVPQELYQYKYTIINSTLPILTGKQLEYNNNTNFEASANTAKKAIEMYYSIDYRTITSTDVNNRDAYLKDLVFYVGEASQYAVTDYMQQAVDHKIVSQAEFITDPSLIYKSTYLFVRGRIKVKYTSGAESYGLQNNEWYYKDIEIGIKPNSGEDRYGYGQTNNYHAMLFISKGLLSLSGNFKKL